LDDRAREEHSRLGSVDADVGEHRVELRDDELCRELVHRGDAGRVLGGQVGLDAGAAPAVGAGNRQCASNDGGALPSPVRTGSGSTGVISAPDGAPRYDEASIGGLLDSVAVGDVMLDVRLPAPRPGTRLHTRVGAGAGGSAVKAACAAARLG